ncbi:MAG: radical SAM protein, partial [Candidatus Methanofastidiosa archaeon]|nr:radical SAM protein [Candidatus Methanofastidiosa archaeon]
MSFDTVPFQDAKLARCDLADGDRCIACQHRCTIKEGRSGICGVRKNLGGHLKCLKNLISYARLDPIERKPIFHFMPGSKVYSIGTVGCNFRCDFCQNHDVSIDFHDYPMTYAPPAMVVRQAIRHQAEGIAFTFNEPTVSLEYYRDVSMAARRKGLYTVLVTNGYLSKEAIDYINPHIDAYIIGVKMFDEEFYRK